MTQKSCGNKLRAFETKWTRQDRAATITISGGEMMKSRWLTKMLAVVLWAGFAGTAFGQSTNSGDIRGTVTDSTGALVTDVTVTVLNVDTGVSKNYTTNHDGVYDTSSIVAGRYTVTFTKAGFEKYVRGPITVDVGVTAGHVALRDGSRDVV